jgi:hypothetical protein
MVVIRWLTDRGVLERATSWPMDRTRAEAIQQQVETMLKEGILPTRPLRALECVVPTLGGASPERQALWTLAREKKRFLAKEAEAVQWETMKKRMRNRSVIYAA